VPDVVHDPAAVLGGVQGPGGPHLPQVGQAIRRIRRRPHLGDDRHEQGDQQRDQADDGEQLGERKAALSVAVGGRGGVGDDGHGSSQSG
jgi:hypothetical protein